jgi:dihydroxyacetone kinase phosphoprotein-dependent L subunit
MSVVLADAGGVVLELVAAINANRAWLSEIDGAIGDGDHGINMSKGFSQAAAAIGGCKDLPAALATLGDTLLSGIGGSMGPLYGTFFLDMAATIKDATVLDAALCSKMLHAGLAGVQDLGNAKVGDKTLLDTLVPALEAFDAQIANFAEALSAMSEAAEAGRDSTKDMVAKIGRAARLGERSRGVLDAGAASCCLILQTLAKGLLARGA